MGQQSPEVERAMAMPARVTPTHVFFMGHETGSPLDCLSQWYEAPFRDEDFESGQQAFRTAEHYMMYSKARLMGDSESMSKIYSAGSPLEAKLLGRKVTPYDGAKWAIACDGIVERGNYLKFSQNPELRDRLLGTADRMLVESNPEDRIWAVGFDPESAEQHESEWGQNKLGKVLMVVRKRLADD